MSKSSNSYILVMGIEPMTVGELYKKELHSTLLHWFHSEYTIEQISKLLAPVFKETNPFNILSGQVSNFGGERELLVNLVVKSDDLKALHDAVRGALDGINVKYLNPEYVGEGWRPHVTLQGLRSLPEGQSVTIKEVYLVECPNGPEIPPIMVRAKYRLGSENPS